MNKKKQIKVIYSKWGLANNFFGSYIEINKRLKYHKKLRDYIIKHELGHVKGFDLAHELKIDWKIMPYLLYFFIKTPSTWIDILPIQYRKKTIIYDLNLIVLYAFAIIITVIGYYAFKFIYFM